MACLAGLEEVTNEGKERETFIPFSYYLQLLCHSKTGFAAGRQVMLPRPLSPMKNLFPENMGGVSQGVFRLEFKAT
jgi:hypothetical protein